MWWILTEKQQENTGLKWHFRLDKHNRCRHYHKHSLLQSVSQFSRSVLSNSLNPMDSSMSGHPVHHQLPEFTQTHVYWVSDVIQPSHPLSSPSPPAFNLSQHQGFFNESVLHIRWPKYCSFSFSISPSNEYLGLISFRIDWFVFLAVQGILKSLLQHHSLKASYSLVLSLLYFFNFFLCDSINRSTPGLPVRHQLLESNQTHVHCVDDAI